MSLVRDIDCFAYKRIIWWINENILRRSILDNAWSISWRSTYIFTWVLCWWLAVLLLCVATVEFIIEKYCFAVDCRFEYNSIEDRRSGPLSLSSLDGVVKSWFPEIFSHELLPNVFALVLQWADWNILILRPYLLECIYWNWLFCHALHITILSGKIL